jgi:NADH-quinone oxidoreductase subunit H
VTVVAGLLLLLGLGCVAGLLGCVTHAWLAGRPITSGWRAGLAGLGMMARQAITTEHPDVLLAHVAPALYLALAVAGAALVPFAAGAAPVTSDVGIVLWGAVETLTVVAVFLHGWSANAPLPLLGAYRYLATGLPAMLLSMFVLIAAALPAQSLSFGAIVEAQRPLWNVLRQPLGLPLFMLLGLSLTLRGPFNYADASDLAGGTLAEVSGRPRLLWQAARLAMLAAFSLVASTVFLGGYLGPVLLPGLAWLVLKTLLVLALMVVAGHLLARPPPSRTLTLLWIVLLPLAFADLVIAGLESLA